VIVDSTTIAYSGNFFNFGSYNLSNVWNYVPGQQAVLSITINGQTALHTTPPLPGGITITADALTVSWTDPVQPGESTMISVNTIANVQTYQAGPGITSPHLIPAAIAYPTPGGYWMQVSMQNDAATDYNLPGIIWGGSVMTCYERAHYDITK
jgi:hypothetical protein